MNENTKLLNEVIEDILDGVETRQMRFAEKGKQARFDVVGIVEKGILAAGTILVVGTIIFMMLP